MFPMRLVSVLVFHLPFLLAAAAHSAPLIPANTVDAKLFSSFSTAKAAAGAAEIVVTTPQSVNTLTVPRGVRLRISEGGSLAVARGGTLTIDGPFEAPPVRVFTGEGRVVFGPEALDQVLPEWWGAGEGVESAAAIQKGIDSIAAGTVVLSAKTYLLNRRVRMRLVGSGDAVSAVLVPKSRVNIRGQGEKSVLKVADGFTDGGDYVVFGPVDAGETSGITFSGFTMDGNGARNLVSGTAGGAVRRAMAIWLFTGRNVRIDGVLFRNQPGTNVVKLGSDSLSYLVTDSSVTGCTFSNVGGAIPGNRGQRDHSTIYVSGRNVTVSGNRLSNPVPYDENGPPPAVVAGIEMHGDDMTVADNLVRNYGTGGYIVADGIVTAKNQRWTGNRFSGMTKLGISIWSVGPVAGTRIESNEIELDGGLDQCAAGIFQPLYPPDTTVGIDGIGIVANSIRGTGVKAGTVWHGIQLTAVRNAVVRENVIERVSGAGILLYGPPGRRLDSRNIGIGGNTIRDTGFNRYAAHTYGIDIVNEGEGTFDSIAISGNLLERSLPLAGEMRGIRVQGKGRVSGISIDGRNRFSGLKREIDPLKEGVAIEPPVR